MNAGRRALSIPSAETSHHAGEARCFQRATGISLALLLALARPPAAAAQQRPLQTQDPETVGAGRVLLEAGISYAQGEFFPLSGLAGNLWQIPVIGINVGLSPIADLQISGGPYNRLAITERHPAPMAGLVTASGAPTHDVEGLALGAKIRFVGEAMGRPAVGFRFSVRLPNAKHESGLGQDTTDFSSSLLVGKTVGGRRALGNVGFTILSGPRGPTQQERPLTYG